MATYPVQKVDRSQAEAFEALGSKPKFWFRDNSNRRILFKADQRGTGEDWAEVIACHLCKLLGLPHVDYELAAEYDADIFLRPGVLCENMAPPPITLVLGNELLLSVDSQYPKQERFKVRQHTVDAIVQILDNISGPSSKWIQQVPNQIGSALDIFTGYIMLDAWIANQDRHHENWGVLIEDFICLAPTFDHGAALARNLTDSEREERLTTKDRNRQLDAFAQKAKSAIYATDNSNRPLGTLETFLAFADKAAFARHIWLNKLSEILDDDVWSIIDKIPPDRMSVTCKNFVFELLKVNRERLLTADYK